MEKMMGRRFAARPLLLLLACCLMPGCGGGGSGQELPLPGPPALNDWGAWSGTVYERQAIIRNQGAFDDVWKERTGSGPTSPAPTIDFTKYDVVLVVEDFVGCPPSPVVTRVTVSGDMGTVHVTLDRRGGNCGAMWASYLLRAVPKLPTYARFAVTEIR
jgi:hypothetical protein